MITLRGLSDDTAGSSGSRGPPGTRRTSWPPILGRPGLREHLGVNTPRRDSQFPGPVVRVSRTRQPCRGEDAAAPEQRAGRAPPRRRPRAVRRSRTARTPVEHDRAGAAAAATRRGRRRSSLAVTSRTAPLLSWLPVRPTAVDQAAREACSAKRAAASAGAPLGAAAEPPARVRRLESALDAEPAPVAAAVTPTLAHDASRRRRPTPTTTAAAPAAGRPRRRRSPRRTRALGGTSTGRRSSAQLGQPGVEARRRPPRERRRGRASRRAGRAAVRGAGSSVVGVVGSSVVGHQAPPRGS